MCDRFKRWHIFMFLRWLLFPGKSGIYFFKLEFRIAIDTFYISKLLLLGRNQDIARAAADPAYRERLPIFCHNSLASYTDSVLKHAHLWWVCFNRPQAVRNRMRLQIRTCADLRTRYASSVLKRCFKAEIVLPDLQCIMVITQGQQMKPSGTVFSQQPW